MHFRTKGRLVGLAFLITTSIMGEAGPAADGSEPVTDYAAHDTEMKSAQTAAHRSLHGFFAHALGGDGYSKPETGL